KCGRAHVGPENAAKLDDGIRGRADLPRELMLVGLVHHVDALAVGVELPAVIDAAQAAGLVPAEEERHAPGRAKLAEQSDATRRAAEGDQRLAEELHAHGRAIRLR